MDVLRSIGHPDEVLALIKFKLGQCDTFTPKHDVTKMPANKKMCYDFLNQTSRSFAAVIQALDGELRDAVCIFYLVLRALDTLEDDMTIPVDEKIPLLRAFHTFLHDPEWKFTRSREKDRIVLERFPVISGEFRKLSPLYQEVISDICGRMGEGMTVYLDRAPNTLDDWDEYCHYVAGLVGMGLSRLFSISGLEGAAVGEDTHLSNSMGLFLQKTNIIRDYLEDVRQNRHFWPRQVWSQYAADLLDLSRPVKREDAQLCLNELVTNALQHAPDVITYMSRIKNQSVFNFCAIPQVMAISTLERCYDNPAVFRGVVKIRKGEAVRLMMEASSLERVRSIFYHFTKQIEGRIRTSTPITAHTQAAVLRILACTRTTTPYKTTTTPYKTVGLPVYVSLLLSVLVWTYWTPLSTFLSHITPFTSRQLTLPFLHTS